MLKLYVSNSLIEVEARKEILDQEGILCTVKNQQGSSLAGEVPFAEVFPELWVINDDDFPRAKEILEKWDELSSQQMAGWTCQGCHEQLDGEFTTCWKCGAEKGSSSKKDGWTRANASEKSEKKFSTRETLLAFFLGGLTVWVGLGVWEHYSLLGYPTDRNRDGKDDWIEKYSGNVPIRIESDDNFDGFFETVTRVNLVGQPTKVELDRDKDGVPDLIEHYVFGIYRSKEIFDAKTGHVKKHIHYKLDTKIREEIDLDDDGKFDKTIYFDEFEDPIAKGR